MFECPAAETHSSAIRPTYLPSDLPTYLGYLPTYLITNPPTCPCQQGYVPPFTPLSVLGWAAGTVSLTLHLLRRPDPFKDRQVRVNDQEKE